MSACNTHTHTRTQRPHKHLTQTDDSPLGTLHVPPGETRERPAWPLPLGQLPAQPHGPDPAVDEEYCRLDMVYSSAPLASSLVPPGGEGTAAEGTTGLLPAALRGLPASARLQLRFSSVHFVHFADRYCSKLATALESVYALQSKLVARLELPQTCLILVLMLFL